MTPPQVYRQVSIVDQDIINFLFEYLVPFMVYYLLVVLLADLETQGVMSRFTKAMK